jgi:hypothetical protein
MWSLSIHDDNIYSWENNRILLHNVVVDQKYGKNYKNGHHNVVDDQKSLKDHNNCHHHIDENLLHKNIQMKQTQALTI